MAHVPTAGDWHELAELLEPGRFEPRNYIGFVTMPAADAASVMAAFHLEDEARRIQAAGSNKTWQWMQAHHGYKAFMSNVQKKIDHRIASAGIDISRPFDERAWVAARYIWQMETERRRASARLRDYLDRPSVRIDRAIAIAMAEALGADDWEARHKALRDALRYVQKARKAITFMLPENRDFESYETREAEAEAKTRWSDEEKSADWSTRNLEREERRLQRDIDTAAAMKTRNGQIRWFLDTILRKLRVNNCGTTAGLRRLVEMLDPESSISDDTIGRIVAVARKREAKEDAWFAKKAAEQNTTGNPQNA